MGNNQPLTIASLVIQAEGAELNLANVQPQGINTMVFGLEVRVRFGGNIRNLHFIRTLYQTEPFTPSINQEVVPARGPGDVFPMQIGRNQDTSVLHKVSLDMNSIHNQMTREQFRKLYLEDVFLETYRLQKLDQVRINVMTPLVHVNYQIEIKILWIRTVLLRLVMMTLHNAAAL